MAGQCWGRSAARAAFLAVALAATSACGERRMPAEEERRMAASPRRPRWRLWRRRAPVALLVPAVGAAEFTHVPPFWFRDEDGDGNADRHELYEAVRKDLDSSTLAKHSRRLDFTQHRVQGLSRSQLFVRQRGAADPTKHKHAPCPSSLSARP